MTQLQTTDTTAAKPLRIAAVDESQFENMLDTVKFEHMWRVAQLYAESKLVPTHYQKDAASCWIACQMAVRLGVDPFMFMQNTYIVQGKPGMESKLVIALVNSSGVFKGPIQWKMEGEGQTRSATAFAVHAKTNELCECTVTMAIARAEGWTDKSGSKWKTMPDQMLRYRSAAWFARLYCPERVMGMQTADEIEDVAPVVRVENTATSPRERVKKALVAAKADPVVTQEPAKDADVNIEAEAGEGDGGGFDELPASTVPFKRVEPVAQAKASGPVAFTGKEAAAAQKTWDILCGLVNDMSGLGGAELRATVENWIVSINPDWSIQSLTIKTIRHRLQELCADVKDWKQYAPTEI